MATFSKNQKVIKLDDSDDDDIRVAMPSVSVSSNPLPDSTSKDVIELGHSILSSNAVMVSTADLSSRGDMEGLKSFLLWNFGGKVPSELDTVASPFGMTRVGVQRPIDSAPARTPSPCIINSEGGQPHYPIATPGEANTHRKRARSSDSSSATKRVCPLPLPGACSSFGSNELVDNTQLLKSKDSSTQQIPYRVPTKQEIQETLVEPLDDSDDEVIETSSNKWYSVKEKNKLKIRRKVNENDIVFDLDDYDDSLYEELVEGVRDLSISKSLIRRNKSVQYPWTVCETALTNGGGALKPGQVLQLADQNLIYVVMILKNVINSEIVLRGYSLPRTCTFLGVLPRKLNEVVWQNEIELDDERPYHQQSMIEQPLSSVLEHRELRITNRLFPAGSFRDTGGFFDMETARRSAPCTLRWKYTSTFLNVEDRKRNKWYEQSLEHIKNGEVPRGPAYLLTDNLNLRFEFRGVTILGGAYGAIQSSDQTTTISKPSGEALFVREGSVRTDVTSNHSMHDTSDHLETIDLTNDDNIKENQLGVITKFSHNLTCRGPSMPPRQGWCLPSGKIVLQTSVPIIRGPYQGYTYGDAFCGAGGATRGALMAGLKVAWGFDIDEHACSSWSKNFGEGKIHKSWAHDFVELGKGNDKMKVDILHLSPPCQFFSPAHTVAGKDDELNSASLFACGELLDVTRPRIATLEQTFGIVFLPRFRPYFNALVHMFTCRGYSIRWKVARLQDWGLPQCRKRLIMIASCPGEPLPEFPPFTHCNPLKPQSNCIPWVSVNSVLENIPCDAPDHNLADMAFKSPYRVPWSGNSITPRCVTTHGGHNYHPSGKRGFTNREFAALQGFPYHHVFSHYNVKKQIGNAVPPSIAALLFKSIRENLEKVDGVKSDHFQLD